MIVGCSRMWASLRRQIMEAKGGERIAIVGWNNQEDPACELSSARPEGSACWMVPDGDLEDLVVCLDEIAMQGIQAGTGFDLVLIDATSSGEDVLPFDSFAHSAAVLSDHVLALVDAPAALGEATNRWEEFACADRVLVGSYSSLHKEDQLEVKANLREHYGEQTPIDFAVGDLTVNDLVQACHHSDGVAPISELNWSDIPRDSLA
eukprot:CAMPEP_0171228386 /NCGR_PEP_ID=MMETSP0790-20130122/38338_1 /TAXON_ID=2925 /ORGANISM="Alexandrium catenella, Strain OF101" /LENGTH=205 /DNA_ID=CAMNT_0011694533 /DNA_START=24 /DNA_END=637 /DNA_ORIENTATION=+